MPSAISDGQCITFKDYNGALSTSNIVLYFFLVIDMIFSIIRGFEAEAPRRVFLCNMRQKRLRGRPFTPGGPLFFGGSFFFFFFLVPLLIPSQPQRAGGRRGTIPGRKTGRPCGPQENPFHPFAPASKTGEFSWTRNFCGLESFELSKVLWHKHQPRKRCNKDGSQQIYGFRQFQISEQQQEQ